VTVTPQQAETAPSPGAEGETVRGLRLRGVSHVYRGGVRDVVSLDPLDLDVVAGEFLVIVGPSGCGKSTLLEILAGLIRPTSGDVFIDDRRVVGPSRDRAVVFQQSTSLYPWLTVRRNVELGLRVRNLPRSERRSRADAELARVGLSEFADQWPHELSGGMQQRCQIARALAVDPPILLLDEPFGALDALTRENLQHSLREIWRETRRTVVMVTHSVEEAVLLGTRVLVMSHRPGRVVDDLRFGFVTLNSTVAEIRSRPDFVETCRTLRSQLLGL